MSFIMHNFYCPHCDTIFEKMVRRSEQDDMVECPECHVQESSRAPSAPLFGDAGRMFAQKNVPQGFKDLLRNIDKKCPGSRLKETSSIDFSSKE